MTTLDWSVETLGQIFSQSSVKLCLVYHLAGLGIYSVVDSDLQQK